MRDFNKQNQHIDNRFNLRLSGDDIKPYREFARLMGVDVSGLLRDAIRDSAPKMEALIDAIHKYQEGDNAAGLEVVTALLAAAHVEIDHATNEAITDTLKPSGDKRSA